MIKFVMTQAVCKEGMDLLKRKANVYIANNPDPNNYLDEMASADAIVVRIARCDSHVIESSPNLKVIGRTGVGFDSIDVRKATELGIPVVITPGANSRSVAEHTISFMFTLSKNLFEAQNQMVKGNWQIRDAGKATELEGKTVGIIGFGNIGKIVGTICKAIDMNVLVYDPVLSRKQINESGYEYVENLDEILSLSDYVTIHVPLLDSTKNMVTTRELSLMKKSAFIINCSRGGIINEDDLVEALKNGTIAGAALDAFCSEPLAPDSPLLTCPNLLLSPHSAAQTKEAVIKMATMCVNGCLAVCEGKKWPYVVDMAVYDNPKWKGADWAF